MNINDFIQGNKYMAVWKGNPGVGKSVAAGSFPGPIYYFDFDGRIEPVVNYWKGKKEIYFDTYHANDYPIFDAKLEAIRKDCPYGTVVVDSLTSLANATIQYQINLRTGDQGKKTRKGVIDSAEISDYGGESAALNVMIDELRKLPCHVIVNAHTLTTVSKNVATNEEITTTSLMTAGKKIAAALPAYFNEVWEFQSQISANVGEPKRKVLTSNGGVNYAKTALPLPPVLEIPSNGDLFSVIQKSLEPRGFQLRTNFSKTK